MTRKTFLFISAYALYPPLLRVAEIIVQDHGLAGHVIAPEEMAVSTIYHPTGKFSGTELDLTSSPLTFHFLSAPQQDALRHGFDPVPLKKLLRQIQPDYIWVHEEFFQPITLQILWHCRFHRGPRIIAYAAHNHSPRPHPLFYARWPLVSRSRLRHLFLWPRLDGVAACATKAAECARRLGVPKKVPIVVNYLPVWGPEEASPAGATLPWAKGNGTFIVGFAGEITEQKGWKVLLRAMEQLPENFKVALVGDGEQGVELQEWLQRPGLLSRAHFSGPLPYEILLAAYPHFDVVVLPSVTLPHSVEQFGRVLAEAMACGVPVIGSDSGAIPETIGDGGLTVPEGDPQALAQAIQKVTADQDLRDELVRKGRKRFRQHYSCAAYVKSLGKLLALP